MHQHGNGPSALIIANPKAGQGDKRAALDRAVEVLRDAGWHVSTRVTEAAGHARELAREAAAAGIDIVVAAGGDGTVNEITDALAGTRVALAVLPAGTGNVLAAQLGLIGTPTALHRRDLPAAAALLTEGVIHPVDVGLAEAGGRRRHFLLWAGVGFDAEVVYRLENEGRALKRRLGVGAAGILGLQAVARSDAVEAVVETEDWRGQAELFMAVVANIPLYAGILDIAEELRLDDGLLDLVLFEGAAAVDKLRHFQTVVTGIAGVGRSSIPCRQVRIITRQPMRLHLDAEPFGHTPVTITALPGAMQLLVPPSAPEGLFAADREGPSVGDQDDRP